VKMQNTKSKESGSSEMRIKEEREIKLGVSGETMGRQGKKGRGEGEKEDETERGNKERGI